MAFRDLFPSWEGVARVTPVISRPEGTGWAGRQGYIQQCLLEVAPTRALADRCSRAPLAARRSPRAARPPREGARLTSLGRGWCRTV
jgi:hypothetical protein